MGAVVLLTNTFYHQEHGEGGAQAAAPGGRSGGLCSGVVCPCSEGRALFEPTRDKGGSVKSLAKKRCPVRGAPQLVPHHVLALVGASHATTCSSSGLSQSIAPAHYCSPG